MEIEKNNKLGKKIRDLRLQKGLTQDDFAREANICYTTLTKIESGVIKKPTVFLAAKIAKTLNITLDKLINNI
ncbi:MAG: helix-turn-helix transcriptional regulator [Patescibacteria group bacterium]|nr:helix-turn-helix transcriptional regulator [Patescibacteria group bacterium]